MPAVPLRRRALGAAIDRPGTACRGEISHLDATEGLWSARLTCAIDKA